MSFKKISISAAIIPNTINIVNAAITVSQSVIAQASGIIQNPTDVTDTLEATLETIGLGSLNFNINLEQFSVGMNIPTTAA